MKSLKPSLRTRPRFLAGLAGVALAGALLSHAFPPAPHHEIHGMARDEYGTPLNLGGAEVVFITALGAEVRTVFLAPGLNPGFNYRMLLPMDAGATLVAYKTNAVRAGTSFRLRVRIGQIDYLPIEMLGNPATLGQPAQKSRFDLTLGEDLDGDGLPDAWERALIDFLGLNVGIEGIRPEGDQDGDGISNRDEYLAGTFAFDAQDGLRVEIARFQNSNPVLKFLGTSGRTYSVQSSTNLAQWTPVATRPAASAAGAAFADTFFSPDVRIVELEVSPDATANRFFKIKAE